MILCTQFSVYTKKHCKMNTNKFLIDPIYAADLNRAKIYKCLIPKLPQSRIAIFLRREDGDIEYKGFRKEENFNEPPTKGDHNKVFNGIGESDSGSPVAAKFLVSSEKRRVSTN